MSDRPLILLADDQADVRFMLSLMLEDEDVELEEASSGEQALRRAAATDYALILLDQRMPPGPDGIDVAERLRESGRTTPIVLYSAYLDPQVQDRARRLGLRTVDKGDPDHLVAVVREAVGS